MPWRLKIVIGFLTTVLLTGTSVFGNDYTYDFQRIIELNQRVTLDLTVPRGNIVITSSEDDRVVIDAVKRIRAGSSDEAQDVADHIEIKVRQVGQSIIIQTNYLRFHGRGRSFWQKLLGAGSDTYGAVDYTIAVPTSIDITINGVATNISLSSIEGKVDIENQEGTTKGEFLFGPITVRQPSGIVSLQWIEGDIRVKTATARIEVNQVRGALDVTSLTGDVYVRTELDSPRNFFVHSSSGNIRFTIPEMSSGKLHIESDAGDIKTDVPISIESVSNYQVVGEFGRGGPSINISSSTGDVHVALY